MFALKDISLPICKITLTCDILDTLLERIRNNVLVSGKQGHIKNGLQWKMTPDGK